MTNAESIPNPVLDPEGFARWYMKIAAGLDADNYPAVLECFLKWLGEDIEEGKRL